jgi:tRNA dimethylallyltransferase
VAKALGGDIINADSVQVYRGLDVGAAKASLEERQGVPHHLMDLVLPTVDYTYEQFLAESRAATEEILSKGKVPIVIGGTGMYMRWYM